MAGITHSWNGSILTITSDSGSSSCDLLGPKGDDGIRGPQGPQGNVGKLDASVLDGYATKDYVSSNAAPSGFGLGGNSKSISTLDDALDNGWYISNQGAPTSEVGTAVYWVCLVMTHNSNYKLQIAFRSSYTPLIVAMRRLTNGVWEEWEYLNPIMTVGREYRTVERWNGKPVYTRIVDCGTLPNASSKDVYLGDGIKGANVVDYNIKLLSASNGLHMMPWLDKSFSPQARAWISSTGYIQFLTNSDMSAYTAVITLKYIKD